MNKQTLHLQELAKLIQVWVLEMTTQAGSGHPSSCLSAVELMVGLMFGGRFRYKIDEPDFPNNDRLIFSKGHAAPLLYALWAAAGAIEPQELMSLRRFDSRLEGHPTQKFPFTEVPTGSLGQGLGIGVGMALSAKMDGLPFTTYVLLGDGEMAEGSNWEAMELAADYGLDNLVGILDVNRFGQTSITMLGHDLEGYRQKIEAFGWKALVVDGHDLNQVLDAYQQALLEHHRPVMIIAKTYKGKGVSLLENQEGWHGKVLNEQQLKDALQEIGTVDRSVRAKLSKPGGVINKQKKRTSSSSRTNYTKDELVSIREAYGQVLLEAAKADPEIIVLDADLSNSTKSESMAKELPRQFINTFIAEQNLVSVGLGLAARGKLPILNTFAAFFTRAHDQLRMAAYSGEHIVCVGSHAGVSIGQDGVSQMGLEDIVLFRSLYNSTVLYPSDAVSMQKLLQKAIEHQNIVYLRSTRNELPVIYKANEVFEIGLSKTVRQSDQDVVTVIAAGITLHEALKAHDQLLQEGVNIRVIDLYSIKPIDVDTLVKACKETKALIVVEDHYPEGGMAEVVRSALIYETTPIYSLCVRKLPKSGKSEELIDYEEIGLEAIVKLVHQIN